MPPSLNHVHLGKVPELYVLGGVIREFKALVSLEAEDSLDALQLILLYDLSGFSRGVLR
jgi:hypothetical protein